MKSWLCWTVFAACLTLFSSGLYWLSTLVLQLDRAQSEAWQRAAFEEDIRLALWRMENALAPLLTRESTRPYFVYSAFYPMERAYTRMFDELRPSEVLVPSLLLTETLPDVLLHFQVDPDLKFTSPRVPTDQLLALSLAACSNRVAIGAAETLLSTLATNVDARKLLAALAPLPDETPRLGPVVMNPASDSELAQNAREAVPNNAQAEPQVANIGETVQQMASLRAKGKTMAEWNSRASQQLRNLNESANQQLVANANANANALLEMNVPQTQQGQVQRNVEKRAAPDVAGKHRIPRDVLEGGMRPVWIGTNLILARRVRVDQRDFIQGCWLDWPRIRDNLVNEVRDLLPHARLEPMPDTSPDPNGRMLAGLPARLEPGRMPVPPSGGLAPLRIALAFGWLCFLIGFGAVGGVLAAAISLSERRAAFVSAVTHELRTPLTTFRMYAEMLRDNLVKGEAKRREYLDTLCAEGNRLCHLVENVLSYARLERGTARRTPETLGVGDLLERIRDRLVQRTDQAGMMLEIESESGGDPAGISVDVAAVEQIVFNLVDNACKYAACAADKRIRITTRLESDVLRIRVQDQGPGISSKDLRRLFRPFQKSAKHAAESAPGVGLGLALSRRLARQMGGDLRVCGTAGPGACLELTLNRAVAKT